MLRKLTIVKHDAGLFDDFKNYVTGQKPTVKDEEAWNAFKAEIFRIYKRINNAYKIYLQGAGTKSDHVTYQKKTVKLKDGRTIIKKIPVKIPSQKINFTGNWSFWLGNDKTMLGRTLKYLYDFLQKIENTQYTVKEEKAKPEKPTEQKPTTKPTNPAQKRQQKGPRPNL